MRSARPARPRSRVATSSATPQRFHQRFQDFTTKISRRFQYFTKDFKISRFHEAIINSQTLLQARPLQCTHMHARICMHLLFHSPKDFTKDFKISPQRFHEDFNISPKISRFHEAIINSQTLLQARPLQCTHMHARICMHLLFHSIHLIQVGDFFCRIRKPN